MSGSCQQQVLAQATATGAITVQGGVVYWTDLHSVQSIAVSGGTVITLASSLSGPYGIAVDSTNVYWTDVVSNGVYDVGLSGGTPTTWISSFFCRTAPPEPAWRK